MENKNCANCQHDLDVGREVTKMDEGVMGLKGFVPLDKTLFFCCEECVSAYFDVRGLPSMPKRIP